ncbi:MAG: BPSS1780 family membrane protein [Arenimonas sp.]
MDPSPYDAPQATLLVEEEPSASGFLAEPRSVEASAGMKWLEQGWNAFMTNPGLWIGMLIVWGVGMIVMGMVPIIGGLASNLLVPVISAGMVLGCDAIRRGEPLRFEHMFAGFSSNVVQLLLIGLINLAITFVVIVVLVIVLFGGLAASGELFRQGGNGPGLALLLGFIALILVVAIPLAMAMAFAPALVVFNGRSAVEALLQSLKACARNLVPLIVVTLIFLVLAVIATLPLMLGWLVLGPVMVAANFAAYREIFYEQP